MTARQAQRPLSVNFHLPPSSKLNLKRYDNWPPFPLAVEPEIKQGGRRKKMKDTEVK